jgi:ribosomal protein S18 acetylase RimI-like enzyme
LRVISNNDPEIELFVDKVAPFIQEAKARSFPFWIFFHESNPIEVLMIGVEPIRLLAKPGTQMAIIYLVSPTATEEIVREYAQEALDFICTNGCEYALLTLSPPFAHYKGLLQEAGFGEYDMAWRMVCNLDQDFDTPSHLKFRQVTREEVREYVHLTAVFMRGSPDIMPSDALSNFDTVSEVLDVHHSQVISYFAIANEETIGVLDLNENSGLIGSVAVSKSYRGKGFGKDITLFGLLSLKRTGCKQAYLRVHVHNTQAIRLYESLGFVKSGKLCTLKWMR